MNRKIGARKEPGTRGRAAEEAPKESEQRLQAILQSSPIPAFVIGRDHRIQHWNKALEELSGLKAGKMIGTRQHWKAFYARKRPLMADLLVDEEFAKMDRLYADKYVKSNLISDAYEATDFFPSLGDGGKWMRFTAALIRDRQGENIGALETLEDISDRKRAEEKLKSYSEQLRSLSARLEMVREEERAAISREIHDELGQALTALKMDVAWLAERLTGKPKGFREKTEAMSRLIDTTIAAVRKISSELRPWVLDELGLTAAIEWQIQQFQSRTGIRCRLPVLPEELPLDRDRNTAIFRIFQETLTNVARHAGATRVTVSLGTRREQVVLVVRDNGRGIMEREISDPGALGILGMKERAHLFGGEIRIAGKPGRGTTVTLIMPKMKPGRVSRPG